MPRPAPSHQTSKASRAPAASMKKQERSLIPVGMTTVLPHAARRVRHLEETLLTTLGRWGYQEIIPPTFEYLDVLSAGLEPELIEKCYKFADRTTGRILLLRPDVTAQIARIVAMGMVGPSVPLRLCYRTTVFRHEPEHAGREREIFQVGAELIGVDDVAADGEILALMLECLTDVYRLLGTAGLRDHLLLDLGEFRGFDYYDGVVFDVFAEGIGYELGGGGRYNHLIGRFGRDLPSTGFALDMDRLFRAMERIEDGYPSAQAEFLISAPIRHADRMFQVGQMLRQKGFRVVQAVVASPGLDAVGHAVAEGRRLGASAVVILGSPRVAADEALVVTEFPTGPDAGRSLKLAPQKVKIKDLLNLPIVRHPSSRVQPS